MVHCIKSNSIKNKYTWLDILCIKTINQHKNKRLSPQLAFQRVIQGSDSVTAS